MAITYFKKPMSLLEKTSWPTACYWGLTLLLFVFLWQLGPLIQIDTPSYLGHSPQRSALYPLLLQLNNFLFGVGNYQFLAFLQLILGFSAIHFLSFKLKNLFTLPAWAILPITFILLTPYFGPTKFGNAILTEAICYPVFLFAFSSLLEGILLKKTQHLLYFLGLTAILILTRRQFLFLYPIFLVVLFYIFFFNRKFFRVPLLSICFVFSILLTNFLERTYTLLKHGHFTTIPFTGIQLIIAPLYIAEDQDVIYFKTDEERILFQKVRQEMHRKHLSLQSLQIVGNSPYINFSIYNHFSESYNPICWETLAPMMTSLGMNDTFKADKLMTQMAFILIQNNLVNYLKLYFVNIAYNLGGWYFNFFLSCLAIITALHYFWKKDSVSLACLLSLMLTGANYSLIALVEPVLRRYSIYTDTIQISMLLVLVMLALKNNSNHKAYS